MHAAIDKLGAIYRKAGAADNFTHLSAAPGTCALMALTMRKLLWPPLVLCALAMAAPRYEATWESLDKRPMPGWFQDARFGIFIHWGVYSVPSFAAAGVPKETQYAEWYWNSITRGKELPANAPGTAAWRFHQRVYGPDFDYAQFAPMFRAELFDPDQWAETFLKSGAKYIVLTSKHHEGFALWPSEEANRTWGRPWNSVSRARNATCWATSPMRCGARACAWASTIPSMSGTTRCG